MEIVEKILTIQHEHGLHARPADLFVRISNSFKSTIEITNVTTSSRTANAKSILGVLSLGVHTGNQIKIVAKGPDCAEAIVALSKLVEGNFKDN